MGRHSKKRDIRSIRNRVTIPLAVGITGTAAASTALVTEAHAATEDQWDAIAQCESGGNWSINWSGDGMSVGGLQFQTASWNYALDYLASQGYDVSSWNRNLYQGMPASEVPSKYQTVLAAEALLHLQGPGAWVCTGNGLSASMFDGGPTPAILMGDDDHGTAPAPEPEHEGKGNPVEVWPDHVHHVVQPGDTLYDITKKYTGDGTNDNWRHTYRINRETVGDNPHLIFPGQDIRVDVDNWGKDGPSTGTQDPPDAQDLMYVAPVDAPVGQVYGNYNPAYTLGYHTGVDFSAGAGTEVVSATGGVVIQSDTSSAYGINVQVEQADGTFALYAHLSGAIVSPGDYLEAGQPIGYVGSTGASTGPHLHFEVRTVPEFGDGNFVDPLDWLRHHGVTV